MLLNITAFWDVTRCSSVGHNVSKQTLDSIFKEEESLIFTGPCIVIYSYNKTN